MTDTDEQLEDGLEDAIHPRQPRAFDVADEHFTLVGPVKVPPNSLYPVPPADSFGSAEYLLDPTLGKVAAKILAAKASYFAGVALLDIRYLWKLKGGQGGGKATLGKTVKPTALLRFATDADFMIWLAADHCAGFTYHQLEALLFHELCHIGRTDDGGRTIIPHDVQAFAAEVREYGLWQPDLRLIGKAVRQLSMDEVNG